jgi:uncharacterized membrane protein YkoI
MNEIDVGFDSNANSVAAPNMHKFGPGQDTRQPINLSNWQITATSALDIALTNGGREQLPLRALHLFRSNDLFVWAVAFGQGGYIFEVRLNATTGEVISKKGFYPTQ